MTLQRIPLGAYSAASNVGKVAKKAAIGKAPSPMSGALKSKIMKPAGMKLNKTPVNSGNAQC